MRFRIATTAGVIAVAGVIGLLLTEAPTWGQAGLAQPAYGEDGSNYSSGSGIIPGSPPGGYEVGRNWPAIAGPGMTATKRGPQHDFLKRLSMLKQRLKHASTDERKEATEQELRNLLGNYFDSDLEMRARQVSDLKARIDELEQLIQKRKDAKSKILDLQLEVIRNEAEGLGFYSTTNNRSGSYGSAAAGALGSATQPAFPAGGYVEGSFGDDQEGSPDYSAGSSQGRAGGPTGPN